MSTTHKGVLLPKEMETASEAEKDAYAGRVKASNRAFVDAYFALEDEAAAQGLTLEDLDR